MRAVVVASEWPGGRLVAGAGHPAPLLPLGDRTVAERVCESLARAGVTRADWVLQPAAGVRDLLGDGTRWGMRFAHHHVRDAAEGDAAAGALVAGFAGGAAERLLLARADRPLDGAALRGVPDPNPVVLFGTGDRDWLWSGWALLTGGAGAAGPLPGVRDERHLERSLSGAAGRAVRVTLPAAPSLAAVHGYLAANRAALRDAAGAQGGRSECGVLVSRSAAVHPTARLVGPVFIGPGCEVGAGAVVGPDVSVGAGSVIDRGAAVADAVVLPDTYVGPGVRLFSVVAERDRVIVPAADGAAAVVACPGVRSLSPEWLGRWRAGAARAVARFGRATAIFRKSVSEGLGAATQPGQRPEAAPIATPTD